MAMAVLAAVIAGCNTDPTKGYTLANQYHQGVDSVAVDVFTRAKDVYRRGLEFRLTEAVVKQIELDTPYKVTDRSRADTLLTGTIVGISQQVMSVNPDTERPRELQMVITVSIRWQDLRTGKIIRTENNIRASGRYIPPVPFREDFFQGSEEAINRLAVRIVEAMEAEW